MLIAGLAFEPSAEQPLPRLDSPYDGAVCGRPTSACITQLVAVLVSVGLVVIDRGAWIRRTHLVTHILNAPLAMAMDIRRRLQYWNVNCTPSATFYTSTGTIIVNALTAIANKTSDADAVYEAFLGGYSVVRGVTMIAEQTQPSAGNTFIRVCACPPTLP